METLKILGLATLAVVFVFLLANYAETQRAKLECRKLQDQARVFTGQGFYITEGEKLQCDYYQIEVDAPVGVRPLFRN
jgi:hypothetical protein